jgi:hypothetical protein
VDGSSSPIRSPEDAPRSSPAARHCAVLPALTATFRAGGTRATPLLPRSDHDTFVIAWPTDPGHCPAHRLHGCASRRSGGDRARQTSVRCGRLWQLPRGPVAFRRTWPRYAFRRLLRPEHHARQTEWHRHLEPVGLPHRLARRYQTRRKVSLPGLPLHILHESH